MYDAYTLVLSFRLYNGYMLRDLPTMNNEDLKRLLKEHNKRLMEGLDKGLPFNTLKELRLDIKAITGELDNRRMTGLLND